MWCKPARPRFRATAPPRGQRGPDGKMVFDANSEWLRDFDTAVKMGLGFRVPLMAGDAAGFDELIVLGLKHSADVAGSEALLTELLAGHRYSAKGMALVPQGTATNNTSGDDAGLDTLDWFAEASFAAEEAGADAAGRRSNSTERATGGGSAPISGSIPTCSPGCRTPIATTMPKQWR